MNDKEVGIYCEWINTNDKMNLMRHKRYLLILSSIMLFFSFQQPIFAQENVFIKEYLERLEKSKDYLILVAETMPEDKYEFKATPESMSFSENLMHIGWAMDWHSQSLMGGRKARDWNTDTELKVDNKSKKEMIAKIRETFDKTIEFISKFNTGRLEERLDYFGADRTKRQILLLLVDHITHHRAQMLVYMRLNGLKPPRYVLYQ
tara:strand:+ start:91 stop:705 length:615 start_codon:yes stop_codon:yes gene_type:complete